MYWMIKKMTHLIVNEVEKSLIIELINDAIENCDHDIAHSKGQIVVKRDKRQWARVKEYEHSIIETQQYKKTLQNIVARFEGGGLPPS